MMSIIMSTIFCSRTYIFFFFQAEDGIRDADVTGVQTCALPISRATTRASRERLHRRQPEALVVAREHERVRAGVDRRELVVRSEERRVGKEGRFRGEGYD